MSPSNTKLSLLNNNLSSNINLSIKESAECSFNKSVNCLSNVSIENSGNFKASANMLNRNPANNSYYFLKASNLNIFKSSNSLNALDLELYDSVSVGSFDRQSFYSTCPNSECDLNSCFIVEQKLIETNSNLSNDKLHLIEESLKLNNKQNNKVANWLENI